MSRSDSKYLPPSTSVQAIAVMDINDVALQVSNSAPIEAYPVDLNHQVNVESFETWPTTNEGSARSYLSELQWPVGLQDTLIKNLSKIPIRYFLCDDSGSMSTGDGHRLVSSGRHSKLISCTRWNELTDSLKFHAGLAAAACATSEFRFLNGENIRIGHPSNNQNLDILHGVLEGSPGGGTPLCRHMRDIIKEITRLAPSLRRNNQKACIVIMTDGESSDGDLGTTMRPLRDLPVWIVVRLCTDSENTVNYWNNIDNDLELEMDVLDDLQGEAEEVIQNNSWLTYGEPMHRLREFGIPIKEIDLLDERKLTKDQMRTVVATILGGKQDTYPHPEADWTGFIAVTSKALGRNPPVWCPITKTTKPWIIKQKLVSNYHGGSCIII